MRWGAQRYFVVPANGMAEFFEHRAAAEAYAKEMAEELARPVLIERRLTHDVWMLPGGVMTWA